MLPLDAAHPCIRSIAWSDGAGIILMYDGLCRASYPQFLSIYEQALVANMLHVISGIKLRNKICKFATGTFHLYKGKHFVFVSQGIDAWSKWRFHTKSVLSYKAWNANYKSTFGICKGLLRGSYGNFSMQKFESAAITKSFKTS